jgi:hypothetical protein
MLKRGEIYFSSVDELNDRHECRPRFILKGNEEIWVRFSHFMLVNISMDEKHYKLSNKKLINLSVRLGIDLKKNVKNLDIGLESLSKLVVDTLNPLLESVFSNSEKQVIISLIINFINKVIPEKIYEHKYITSFSTCATNPTMWGHYADAERGFAIVYETDDGTIEVKSLVNNLLGSRKNENGITVIGGYKEEKLKLEPVIYGRKPPKVNVFNRLVNKFFYSDIEDHYDVPAILDGDIVDKQEYKVGLVKFSDWRYEREIRAFLRTKDEIIPTDIRVLQVHPYNIKGIIFGSNMSVIDRERAITCCYLMRKSILEKKLNNQMELSEFVFFEAKEGIEYYDVDIVPIGTLIDKNFGRVPFRLLNRHDEETQEMLFELAKNLSS